MTIEQPSRATENPADAPGVQLYPDAQAHIDRTFASAREFEALGIRLQHFVMGPMSPPCAAAEAIAGHAFHIDNLPKLPLQGCTRQGFCACAYRASVIDDSPSDYTDCVAPGESVIAGPLKLTFEVLMARGRIIFKGNFGEYFLISLGLLLLSAVTFGLAFPYFLYWSLKYFFTKLEIEFFE